MNFRPCTARHCQRAAVTECHPKATKRRLRRLIGPSATGVVRFPGSGIHSWHMGRLAWLIGPGEMGLPGVGPGRLLFFSGLNILNKGTMSFQKISKKARASCPGAGRFSSTDIANRKSPAIFNPSK
jgi:hypothetical protein